MHTWMKSTRNIRRSVRYPMQDKAVQREARVAGVACGGGIIDTGDRDSIVKQFNYPLSLTNRLYRKGFDGRFTIQGIIRTFSFSEKEISPSDKDWVEKALAVVTGTMNNIAKDCQWIGVAQKDGKAGLVHVHVVQSVIHNSTLTPVSGRETSYDIFRKVTEAVMEKQGITLDSGRRRKTDDNSEAAQRHKHAKEVDGYSWMDDLKRRIEIAASQTTASGAFEEELRKAGVTVSRKARRGWTFVLADSSRPEWIGKKASYDRFDTDFSMPALNKRFKTNYQIVMSQRAGRPLPDISNVFNGPAEEDQQDRSL